MSGLPIAQSYITGFFIMGMNHNANCSTERAIKASMIFRWELKRDKYEAVSRGESYAADIVLTR